VKKYLDIVKKEFQKNPEPIIVVKEVLRILPKRTMDVTEKRFGLDGEEPKTLEKIGKNYGITRERVRQIEASAFNKIKNTGSDAPTRPIADVLETIFREEGGVLTEEKLFQELLEFNNNAELNARAIRFILSISDKFYKIKETEKWKMGWTLDQENFKTVNAIINDFINLFGKTKKVVSEDQLKQFLVENGSAYFNDLDNSAIVSYIGMSKNIGRNPFGQWGKKEWAEISPRGVRDKAYLVMLHTNEPMHFRVITEKINNANFGGRQAFSQTVHNELIKDDRFELMGRGIYALRKNKAESDLIKNNLIQILKEIKQPISKDEIIKKISSVKNVKKSSVSIALQDSKIFKKTKENKYTLCSMTNPRF